MSEAYLELCAFQEGETLIGTEDADVKQDIVLNGLGIEAEHCSVVLKDGVATLVPRQQAQCWVNTVLIDKPTRLSQGKHICRQYWMDDLLPHQSHKILTDYCHECCSKRIDFVKAYVIVM